MALTAADLPLDRSYHLIVAGTCPFSGRVWAVWSFLGLEGRVSLSVASPIKVNVDGKDLWAFAADAPLCNERDPIFPDAKFVKDCYAAAPPPGWDQVNSVPVLVDVEKKQIVMNSSLEICRFFERLAGRLAELRPTDKEVAIDSAIAKVARLHSNSYKSVAAKTQAEWDALANDSSAVLDQLEASLASQDFLADVALTEADLIAFPTLVRWDFYYPLLSGYSRPIFAHLPNLAAWLKRVAALNSGAVGKTWLQDHYDIAFSRKQVTVPINGIVRHTCRLPL